MMQTDKEYAEALFMLAAEEKQVEEYLADLKSIQQLIRENPAYIEFLASPAISLQERLAAIDEAFAGKVPAYIEYFLKLLTEGGRIRLLDGCIGEFERLVMQLARRAPATVYTAAELTDEQKEALCRKLEARIGKGIDPVYVLDRSLIGGLKIEIEGKTYDGSVKHRLREVKEVMIG